MSEGRSVSAEVEVAVDPPTAFSAFTQEMDLWWVRGPINFFDASRAVAMTCEPGVGGRLLEVYDEAAGDALELGRITVWQPGERVCWQSSVDDVVVDVRFDPTDGGTIVRVSATIPAGGTDRGGTSWVRVVPPW
ncbi:MAG TPA: bleomycin resistance protein, partial [Actinomycetota bacterium]|nr:bleomycin resistance protein [Actinomycetota bacterium]